MYSNQGIEKEEMSGSMIPGSEPILLDLERECSSMKIVEHDPSSEEKLVSRERTVPKKKTAKRSSAAKPTGYILFCKEHRADVKEENPEVKGTEITKILAGIWRDLPEDEQEFWKSRASEKR